MRVVDAQIHPGKIGPAWGAATPDEQVDRTIAAMDAVGVHGALLDEWRGWDERGRIVPGHDHPNGARRAEYPVSLRAIARYPQRFAYYARVERTDPEMAEQIADLRRHPGRLCLRWCPPAITGELAALEAGAYDGFFTAARAHRIPVFLSVPGQSGILERYVRAHADLWFVIDHCGVAWPLEHERSDRWFDGFAEVIRMARYPNVALKWCHAPRLSREPFPFRDLSEHLTRVLEAFGPERVMWASDCTEALRPMRANRTFTWAEALYSLLATDTLSVADREWLFGRTVRRILDWPEA